MASFLRSLHVETAGHSYEGVTGFWARLSATGTNGLSTTTSVYLQPIKVDVKFTSSSPELTVLVDGLPLVTPFVLDGLVGFE